ncbi:MAG: molecular chaperone DnaJ [Desulfuromonadales bacterium C00003107]|jgi:DnaJ-class molecular chaperone|nr:MAG: molecular chaperone DnaJ [Desulfuromonadales bacterium C00003107]
MDYTELQSALKVFGLGERATLKEIKTRHRVLVKRYHPDGGEIGALQVIQEVNAAYKLLLDYVGAYSFSFAEAEFYEQCPEERLRQQFGDDPLWGRD